MRFPAPLRRLAPALAAALALTALAAARAQDDEAPIRSSIFASPLYLGEDPPEVRSLRHLHLVHRDAVGAARNVDRTLEEARALGAALRRAVLDGADFARLARTYSSAPDAPLGGVLGTYAPGVLQPAFDEFLFSARVGEVSPVLVTPTGVHVLQRIERLAGARHVQLDGDSEEVRLRILELRERVLAGEPFEDVAREESSDPWSAPRGGALAVFERGPADRLLKAAAFELAVGEVSEPIRTAYGWHLVQRVAPEEIPDDLVERNWMEFRGLAVLHSENPLGVSAPQRTAAEAGDLAREIEARLRAGEDFAALAAVHDDDPAGGRERGGRIGWVHRRHPGLPHVMREAFALEPGDWLGPQATNVGWVFVQRIR